MVQLIVFIIFLGSLAGISFILFKKIPALVQLPQNGHHGFKKHRFFIVAEKKLKDIYFRLFKKQMLLHKLLSWTKVFALKVETKVDALLHSIRRKAQLLEKKVKEKK